MPKHQARFRFEMDKKVAVNTRRTLEAMATRHIQGSAMVARVARRHLLEALRWCARLDEMETRFLGTDLLVGEARNEAVAEQELRTGLNDLLTTANRQMEALHTAKQGRLEALEERVDPFFTNPNQPVRHKPRLTAKQVLEEEERQAQKAGEHAAAAPPPPIPPPVTVKLDPTLIEQARLELVRRGKEQEITKNEIPAPFRRKT